MKKLAFLLGLAVGFLLGSKVGREPYAQMREKVREVAARPEVQDAVNKAKGAASAQFGQLSEIVSAKLPSSSGADGARSGGDSTRSSVLQRTGA
jgi:hypothetical protein